MTAREQKKVQILRRRLDYLVDKRIPRREEKTGKVDMASRREAAALDTAITLIQAVAFARQALAGGDVPRARAVLSNYSRREDRSRSRPRLGVTA